ncbi:MAG: hypothetical protein PHW69_02190 [Elusimicrobiaceae bacterium]|nr:hypothetical protein [Elusimicrobiaceae bacterium]
MTIPPAAEFFKLPGSPGRVDLPDGNPLPQLPAPRAIAPGLRLKMFVQFGDEWLLLLIIAVLLWVSIAIGLTSSPLAPLAHIAGMSETAPARTGTCMQILKIRPVYSCLVSRTGPDGVYRLSSIRTFTDYEAGNISSVPVRYLKSAPAIMADTDLGAYTAEIALFALAALLLPFCGVFFLLRLPKIIAALDLLETGVFASAGFESKKGSLYTYSFTAQDGRKYPVTRRCDLENEINTRIPALAVYAPGKPEGAQLFGIPAYQLLVNDRNQLDSRKGLALFFPGFVLSVFGGALLLLAMTYLRAK